MTNRRLEDDRWVKLMAELGEDGLWTIDGDAASADQLPVDAALRARLRCWREAWESQEEETWDRPDLEAFSAEGREIARSIKAALPEWTVIYYDEAAAQQIPWERAKQDRPLFEYEIEASPPTQES